MLRHGTLTHPFPCAPRARPRPSFSPSPHMNPATVRAVRFSSGVSCPHCHGSRIQRWGHFADRQRFRCRDCRRTFSDLTGTRFAYLKRLELWDSYTRFMFEGLSVRAIADRLRIDKNTAFRWRHLRLAALDHRVGGALDGVVETYEMLLPHSCKGSRRPLGRPPRRRGLWPGQQYIDRIRMVCVLIACSRAGAAASWLSPHGRPSTRELKEWLIPELGRPCTLVGGRGPYSSYASSCVRSGIDYRPARDLRPIRPPRPPPSDRPAQGSEQHGTPRSVGDTVDGSSYSTGHARASAQRLQVWLLRFRGVATRYLEHYLRWHLAVDRVPGGNGGAPDGGDDGCARGARWRALSLLETLVGRGGGGTNSSCIQSHRASRAGKAAAPGNRSCCRPRTRESACELGPRGPPPVRNADAIERAHASMGRRPPDAAIRSVNRKGGAGASVGVSGRRPAPGGRSGWDYRRGRRWRGRCIRQDPGECPGSGPRQRAEPLRPSRAARPG
jgi:transposase-like protein